MRRSVVVLDIGGSSVKSGIVDAHNRLAGPIRRTSIDAGAAAGTIVSGLADIANLHLAAIPAGAPPALILAVPGPFDHRGGVSWMRGQDKYETLYGLDIGHALRLELEHPLASLTFTNDAEAAVLGECRLGAGRPFARVIGLSLGTGLGSAFVADGAVIRTGDGVPSGGRLYGEPVGTTGLADERFSTRGITRALSAVAPVQTSPALGAERARRGDRRAAGVFATFGADLGRFLQPHVEAFGADAVIVRGGLANAFDLFADELRAALAVIVERGVLGDAAPLLGAAGAARQSEPSR